MATELDRRDFIKRTGVVVAGGAVAAGLAACSSDDSGATERGGSSRPERVSEFPPNQAEMYPSVAGKTVAFLGIVNIHPLIQTWVSVMEERASRNGIKLSVFDAETNAQKQFGQLDEVLNGDADVIILHPVDAVGASKRVRTALDEGIPVITINGQTLEYPTVHIGVDLFQQGMQAAEYIGEALNGQGQVASMMGEKISQIGASRYGGFVSTIEKRYPDLQLVVDLDNGGWVRDQAREQWGPVIQANPDIKAVYAGNDEQGIGIALANEAAGVDDMIIFGADGLRGGYEAVKAGQLTATSAYDGVQQGNAMMDLSEVVLTGGLASPRAIQAVSWTPSFIVDSENVDQLPLPPS